MIISKRDVITNNDNFCLQTYHYFFERIVI